jgi:polygalacturonase
MKKKFPKTSALKKLTVLILLCLPTLLFAKDYNISDYGALGDGATVNTVAIQKAIDECTKTGGTVVVSNGVFITGTIYLKDNVLLKIEAGATLKGSGNIADYTTDTYKHMYKGELALNRCLIFAKESQNITISGGGTVDGNDKMFPAKDDPQKNRPMLFRFLECKRLKMSNFFITNTPSWATAWLYCSDIVVDAVTINSSQSATSDCLDFDGCVGVRVSNCNLTASDDCLCLQSSKKDKPCRDFTITNCMFTSTWDAIRIGLLSRGNIETVTVSNCVFKEIGHVGIQFELCEGGDMGNMVFTGLSMQNVRVPIYMAFFQQRAAVDAPMEMAPMGTMKGFVFSNIVCKFEKVSSDCSAYVEGITPKNSLIFISGLPGHKIEDIQINNMLLETNGGATKKDFENVKVPELTLAYLKGWWAGMYTNDRDHIVVPANGIYARHVKGLKLNNVVVSTRHPDERPYVVIVDGK